MVPSDGRESPSWRDTPAESADVPSCTVAVLVPHASGPAMLVQQEGLAGSDLTLPCVELAVEPPAGAIVSALDTLFGQPVTLLRANTVVANADNDAVAMVVEIEPLARDVSGFGWQVCADGDEVAPTWAGESVTTWVSERRYGWAPLRPQWSRTGWYVKAAEWTRAQMLAAGMRRPQAPQLHQLWGISVVLVADSDDGRAFFKCSGSRFEHEGAITRALAQRTPEHIPTVLADDRERGWLLTRDFGDVLLEDRPESEWGQGLDALAEVQQAWLGHTDQLLAAGAENRPLTDLVGWVVHLHDDDDFMARLNLTADKSWVDVAASLVDACEELEVVWPTSSLAHGDLHPGNIAMTPTGPCLFDWTDAAVTHPLVDLVSFVVRAKDPVNRDRLVDRYLSHWRDSIGSHDMTSISQLAFVVGNLYQAHTYALLLPTVMPSDRGMLANMDVVSMQRAVEHLTPS